MKYSMEAVIEASRLEEQVYQTNYSIAEEVGRFEFGSHEVVMDAGCGTGVLARYLVEKCNVKHVDGLDGSDLRLKQATDLSKIKSLENRISFHQQDLSRLDPKFYGKYDTVICRYVLEHTVDPVKVMGELRKALKKDGRLIIYDLDGVFINLYTENSTLNGYMREFQEKSNFDLEIGRKLPSYLKKAGFTGVTWESELLACKGKRLEEERDNTVKRFIAIAPFMTDLFGSSQKFEEFKELYLQEMVQPENTLVFTKYICAAKNQ